MAIETVRITQANGPGIDPDQVLSASPDSVIQGFDDTGLLDQIQAMINDTIATLLMALAGVTDVTPDLLASIIQNSLDTTAVGNFGAPPVPSAPSCQGIPSGIWVTWDGLNADHTNYRPPDYDHVDVHVSTTPNFTPDDTTKVGSIQATPNKGGSFVYPTQQYGVVFNICLVAVNLKGDQSAPSTQVQCSPLQITTIDVADYSLLVTDTYSPSHVMF